MTLVSCSPRFTLPTIHKDITNREDSDPEVIAHQDFSSVDPDDSEPSSVSADLNGEVANRDAEMPIKTPSTKSKSFRRKYRRIKNPVRRRNRVLLLLKSEMGKVQIAIEDVKDDCLRKKLTEKQCGNLEISLLLQGKLNRIESAFMSVKALGPEAERIQDMEVQAEKDLQNATKFQTKAKTILSGRMVALKDVEKRIAELEKEDRMDANMQDRFEQELNNGWHRMKAANEAQRTIEGYNVKFSSKIRGIIQGIQINDASAAEDFDTATAIEKQAELVDARATVLEDKAKRILEERGKNKDKADTFEDSRDSVQYQENEDGILASDSATPLDSFGVARPHPTFGKQQFMAQNQPLLVGKQDKLNHLGEKSKSDLGETSKFESHNDAQLKKALPDVAVFNKDTGSLSSKQSDVGGLDDADAVEDGDVAD